MYLTFPDIDLDVAFPNETETLNHPYISWYNEDKSKYPKANATINPKTGKTFYDDDGDFLVGASGGFLMNEDFVVINTHLFTTVANHFEITGKYTDAEIDSVDYVRFHDEEVEKRKYGVTEYCKVLKSDVLVYNATRPEDRAKYVKALHISGEQYNLLNYGRMSRTEDDNSASDVSDSSKTKKDGFPRFFISQYWWGKIKRFARINGLNLVMGKARRAGWSYQEAIDSANDANLYASTTNIFAAYDLKYLTKGRSIARMAFDQLNFYEEFTPFNRCGRKPNGDPAGLYKKELDDLQLGFRLKDGTPSGYQSKLLSLSFGADVDAAIGKDAIKIKIEELSNTPNLFAFLNVTEPTTRAGSYKVGTIIGFGTGGSTEGDWFNFKIWFYQPSMYDAMEFENVWDKNSRNRVCGYYKMYIQNLEGVTSNGTAAIDKFGNSNYTAALEISNAERLDAKSKKSTSDYIVYVGQYSNSPQESFGVNKDNDFVTPELLDHISRVEHDPDYRFYTDGWITRNKLGRAVFKSNRELTNEGSKIHDFIPHRLVKKGDDLHGALRVFYPPETNDEGLIPDNLYRITYDPVAIDKDTKSLTKKDSLHSFKVRQRINNFSPTGGDTIVASYTGRPDKNDTVFRLLLDTADMYNAKILPETDRGDTVAFFRKHKRLDRLVKQPHRVFNLKVSDVKEDTYGITIGKGNRKSEAITYFREWLHSTRGNDSEGVIKYNFHYIFDLPFLEEIRDWNPDDNFDRLSDFLLAMFDDKELSLSKQAVKDTSKKSKKSIFKKEWYS